MVCWLVTNKVEISRKTIVFTVFFLLGLWLVFYMRELILELFVAVLIMTILNPLVNLFKRFHIPRSLSVLIAYVLMIGTVVVLVVNLAPPLVEQSANFVNGLPVYINSLGLHPEFGDRAIEDLLSQIGVLPAHFAQFALSIFSNLFEVMTVLVFAFYMLLSRNQLDDHISYVVGESKKEKVADILNKLEARLGGWARGQLSLMLVVGIATYVGLKLLGVPFALPLAILAGLLEIIPFVGPFVAAVPAVIIGFGISPVIGFSTVAMAFLIQQLENYFFVPTVMQRSVGVPSLLILISLAVGFRLFGVVGAIISIPTLLALNTLWKELPFTRKIFTL